VWGFREGFCVIRDTARAVQVLPPIAPQLHPDRRRLMDGIRATAVLVSSRSRRLVGPSLTWPHRSPSVLVPGRGVLRPGRACVGVLAVGVLGAVAEGLRDHGRGRFEYKLGGWDSPVIDPAAVLPFLSRNQSPVSVLPTRMPFAQ
jgi:hypothetical protein